MEIQRIEIKRNCKLCVIKNPRQKSIIIWVHFYFPLNESASQNALLSRILLKGSGNYKSSRIISKVLYENYGTTIGTDINLKGEIYTLGIYCNFVNPKIKLIDNNLVENVCSIMKDIIYNPLFEQEHFLNNFVDIEKENLLNSIRNKINDKDSYAFDKCIEIMCSNEPYSIDKLGKEEWINESNAINLTERYFKIIREMPLNIYIMGDTDDELIEKITRLFELKDINLIEKAANQDVQIKVKEVEESFDIFQSRLCFGFRTGTNLNDEDYPALALVNNMLGGGPHSLLFKEIREKRSLCYSISSSLEKYKKLLLINCGIDKDKKETVKEEIFKIINSLKMGSFTDEDFKNALINSKHNLASICDSPYYYISYLQGLDIYNSKYTIEEFIQKLERVTKEEIMAVSDKIKLDTIYFLGSRG